MTDDARIATGNLRVNANDPIPTDYAERAKGMGVSIINGGAAFRVWAPHAEAVAVTGTFDDWAAQPDGSKDDAQKVSPPLTSCSVRTTATGTARWPGRRLARSTDSSSSTASR